MMLVGDDEAPDIGAIQESIDEEERERTYAEEQMELARHLPEEQDELDARAADFIQEGELHRAELQRQWELKEREAIREAAEREARHEEQHAKLMEQQLRRRVEEADTDRELRILRETLSRLRTEDAEEEDLELQELRKERDFLQKEVKRMEKEQERRQELFRLEHDQMVEECESERNVAEQYYGKIHNEEDFLRQESEAKERARRDRDRAKVAAVEDVIVSDTLPLQPDDEETMKNRSIIDFDMDSTSSDFIDSQNNAASRLLKRHNQKRQVFHAHLNLDQLDDYTRRRLDWFAAMIQSRWRGYYQRAYGFLPGKPRPEEGGGGGGKGRVRGKRFSHLPDHTSNQTGSSIDDPRGQREAIMSDYLHSVKGLGGDFNLNLNRYTDLMKLYNLQQEEKEVVDQLSVAENNYLRHVLERIRQEKLLLMKKLEEGRDDDQELDPDPYTTVTRRHDDDDVGGGGDSRRKKKKKKQQKEIEGLNPNPNLEEEAEERVPAEISERLALVLRMKEEQRKVDEDRNHLPSIPSRPTSTEPPLSSKTSSIPEDAAGRSFLADLRSDAGSPTQSPLYRRGPPKKKKEITPESLRSPPAPTGLSIHTMRKPGIAATGPSAKKNNKKKKGGGVPVSGSIRADSPQSNYTHRLRRAVPHQTVERHPASAVLELYGLSSTMLDPYKL